MSIVLFRVDERLIHGQVVVGWGMHLNMDRIAVVDDSLSASSWEQELYCLGVPPAVETIFMTVEEARGDLPAWRNDERRTVVLVRDLDTLGLLAEGGLLQAEDVNLGGIHFAPGRERVLPYIFLSGDERDHLKSIADTGAQISARDLPGSRAVPMKDLLGKAG